MARVVRALGDYVSKYARYIRRKAVRLYDGAFTKHCDITTTGAGMYKLFICSWKSLRVKDILIITDHLQRYRDTVAILTRNHNAHTTAKKSCSITLSL